MRVQVKKGIYEAGVQGAGGFFSVWRYPTGGGGVATIVMTKGKELVPRSENRVGLLLSVSTNYSVMAAETMNWELLQKKYGYILRRFLERYVLPKQGNGKGRRYEDRFGFRRGTYAQILYLALSFSLSLFCDHVSTSPN